MIHPVELLVQMTCCTAAAVRLPGNRKLKKSLHNAYQVNINWQVLPWQVQGVWYYMICPSYVHQSYHTGTTACTNDDYAPGTAVQLPQFIQVRTTYQVPGSMNARVRALLVCTTQGRWGGGNNAYTPMQWSSKAYEQRETGQAVCSTASSRLRRYQINVHTSTC